VLHDNRDLDEAVNANFNERRASSNDFGAMELISVGHNADSVQQLPRRLSGDDLDEFGRRAQSAPVVNRMPNSVPGQNEANPRVSYEDRYNVPNRRVGSASGANRARSERYSDNEDDDDEDGSKRRRFQEASQRNGDDNLRVEYINEGELDADYANMFDVEYDARKDEYFIIDYSNSVKYVIVKERAREPLVIEFVDASVVRSLGNAVRIQLDESTNEQFVEVNGVANRRWIVLQDGWQESQYSSYVNEEDVDSTQWNVYVDENQRKFIVDDKSGVRYYLVPPGHNQAFLSNWSRTSGSSGSSARRRSPSDDKARMGRRSSSKLSIDINDSNDGTSVIVSSRKPQPQPDSEAHKVAKASIMDNMVPSVVVAADSRINVNYVQLEELPGLNIAALQLYEDPVTKETYFEEPDEPRNIWILLASDWRESESTNYISEHDIEPAQFTIHSEDNTNRRFIFDDESNQKFYIVPSRRDSSLLDALLAKFNQNMVQYEPNADQEVPKPSNKLRVRYIESAVVNAKLRKPNYLQIFEDPETLETYYQDPNDENNIWIILPEGWRESESLFYIHEEDIDEAEWNVQVEETTNRRFIIDRDSKRKYYIVSFDSDASFSEALRPTDEIQQLDHEPARPSYCTDPKPVPNGQDMSPKSSKKDKERFYIKQRDRMGHLIYQDPKFKPASKYIGQSIKMYNKSVKVLPHSPRPLHHLLLDDQQRLAYLNSLADLDENSSLYGSSRMSSAEQLNAYKSNRAHDNDPTASRDRLNNTSLDRDKLVDIYVNGWRKELPARKGASADSMRSSSMHDLNKQLYSTGANGITTKNGGESLLRGYLREEFHEENNWRKRRPRNEPATKLKLKQQVLATPKSQLHSWQQTLQQSDKMKPRIILITDEERILAADRKCKVYVQYMYENESVLGSHPAYMLMLPNRGPVSPTRPLMLTPKQLGGRKAPEIALREAPVYVYHGNGSAYFENIAQYLAGDQPKLSPSSVQKILQFANMAEFEHYLEAKLTREKAKKIAQSTAANPIEIDALKRDLVRTLTQPKVTGTNAPSYHHFNCEYDDLRAQEGLGKHGHKRANETTQVDIGGVVLKSTFLNFLPTGVQKVNVEDLPPSVIRASMHADELERTLRRNSANFHHSSQQNIYHSINEPVAETPRAVEQARGKQQDRSNFMSALVNNNYSLPMQQAERPNEAFAQQFDRMAQPGNVVRSALQPLVKTSYSPSSDPSTGQMDSITGGAISPRKGSAKTLSLVELMRRDIYPKNPTADPIDRKTNSVTNSSIKEPERILSLVELMRRDVYPTNPSVDSLDRTMKSALQPVVKTSYNSGSDGFEQQYERMQRPQRPNVLQALVPNYQLNEQAQRDFNSNGSRTGNAAANYRVSNQSDNGTNGNFNYFNDADRNNKFKINYPK